MSHIPETQSPSQNAAPAKSSGGSGFNHEDEVAAYYLAQLLTGAIPFGIENGTIKQIKLQTRVDGWLLDDLLLTLSGAEGERFCAYSIKSNRQFTTNHAAPSEFVHQCWEQILNGGPMDPNRDLLAFAVSGVPSDVLDDFNVLRGLACAAEPDSLEDRLKVKYFVDDGKRAMAASFACPQDLKIKFPEASTSDSATVLSRILVIDFDFPSTSSRSRSDGLRFCGQALRDQSPEAASRLWEDLCTTARTFRPLAGMFDLPRLIEKLRSKHDLAGYPDHRSDWQQLNRYTNMQLDVASRWTIAGRLSLPRLLLHKRLDEVSQRPSNTAKQTMPILVGRSGDGKSVIARQWLASGSPQVWLDARLFETSHGENPITVAEDRLKIRHRLEELLQSAPGKRPRLVIDGIGRLSNELSLQTVANLARDVLAVGWEAVATCQDDDWERAAHVFHTIDLYSAILQVEPFTNVELREIAESEPYLRPLIAKPDLRRVLSRPKYLDVVLRGVASNNSTSVSESNQWTGEAHVAEWCWRHVVEGVPPRTERTAAAKQMALQQADAMRDSVAEDDLDAARLPAIDTLIAEGVCRKIGERLIFDHDLLGDWGRQRVLLSQTNIVAFLTDGNRGVSPFWLRALRLWALDVLERQGDHTKWISTVRDLATAGEVAAADRVLEAVAVAAGASEHLEKVWPALCGNDKLIRRLLERFLRSATRPNPVAMDLITKLGDRNGNDLKTWAAAEYRIPLYTYWPALLNVLYRHRDDVSRFAPGEASRLVRLWLLNTTSGMPFRGEAAAIAVATARNVYHILDNRNYRHSFRGLDDEWSLCNDAERLAYDAILISAVELPNEVIDFALTVAKRKKKVEIAPEEPGVEYAPPWVDGPSHHVSEEFRDAILKTETFLPLATVSADTAKEVLLAVLIDSPNLEKHPGMLTGVQDADDDFSIAYLVSWSPALFSRGPFSTFLQVAPKAAIDAIVRLVNFATERWLVHETRDIHNLRRRTPAPRPIRLTISDGGSVLEWQGSARVFFWYEGSPHAPVPVTCALMALEKWLYDRLDKGDDIAEELDQIKKDSRSVAFAGLLSAVARYRLNLLENSLAFLFGVPEFLYWELNARQTAMNSAGLGWQLGPIREPHLVEQAKKWYAMPHRKTNLFTLAQYLFLNFGNMRKLIESHLPEWKTRAQGEQESEYLHAVTACLKTFDIDRWEVVDQADGRKAWVQKRTAEEIEEGKDAIKEADDTLLRIDFPYRCRTLLDSSSLMNTEELDQFWIALQKVSEQITAIQSNIGNIDNANAMSIDEQIEADGVRLQHRSVLDGIMGGIAVLLLRYPAYLESNRSRNAWVLRQLRRIPHIPLPQSDFDHFHPDERNDHRWECFYASVVIHFLCQRPASAIWRLNAAMLVTGFHYSPVRNLFASAFRQREELNGGFEELCHLLLRWSAVRWHNEHVRNGWQINVDVQAEWRRLIDAFLNGELAGPLPTFKELATSPRELPEKPMPPEHFRHGLDLTLIAAAFDDLMRPNQALTDEERSRWLQFWRDLLNWRLSPMPGANDQSVSEDEDEHDEGDRWNRNNRPYPSDDWLLDRIADTVIQLRPSEQHQSLWRPLFDLVPKLQPWGEHFLISLFMNVLRLDPLPETFPKTWLSMRGYASSSERWNKANDTIWARLLGFDHLLHDCWDIRHTPLLRSAIPFIDQYIRTKLRWGSQMRQFLDMLKMPVAEDIRLGFLPSLAFAIEQRPHLLHHDGDTVATSRFLDFCWLHHNLAIANDAEQFAAFTEILGTLVALQDPLASELQDRLRRH